jgi:fumarate reductase flavoprotein subunit
VDQKTLSRRSFLKGGAIGAVALAASGALSGCASPKDRTSEDDGASESLWKTAPAAVSESAIENTYECECVVVGDGYAGVTAFRELAEEGHKVMMVEQQQEDQYVATGNEFAALNAKVLQDRGVGHIDPIDFFQNFMKVTGNEPNPDLVMKFAQNSEANSNWYLDQCTDDDIATMTTSFFPPTEHQMTELMGIKFWASVCSFYGDCNETKLQGYNRQAGINAGGEVHFHEEAYYLEQNEDGSISGLITKAPDGNYNRYKCKAVVLACGGFGGNGDMMKGLMPDVYGNLVGDEYLYSMSGNSGAGVKMAYWAGAHLETSPIPGMNFRGLSVPGKMNCLPQAVWVDSSGKRFCNEYWPTSEYRGLQNEFKPRETEWAVVDANFPQYRQYTLPQHAGFTASEANIQELKQSLDKAYAKFKGTYVDDGSDSGPAASGGPVTTVEYIADDTLEGLGRQMGFEGDTLRAFLDQMAHYNECCVAGADDQYGRDASVLFPCDTAPYYACSMVAELGGTMVTCGGIITDGEQNALDKDFKPIPGLYVSGNDCGRRFGKEYITPIPGCSLGFAIVLGRECGKSVGKFLSA